MCRYNQLWGLLLISFGLGILIGIWISGGFFCHLIGFGLICAGVCVLRRK